MANEPRFEVYPRKAHDVWSGEAVPMADFGWRFHDPDGRFVNANEQTVALSGSGFQTREKARASLREFLTAVGGDPEDTFLTPPIIDVEE